MLEIARKYKMSDSTLMLVGTRLIVGANRDATELSNFGWTAARVSDLSNARDAFADLPTDVELSGIMSVATAAKNKVRQDTTEFCAKEIMLRVSQHYGEGSPNYNRFRFSDLYTSSDHGLWLVLKRIHRQATLLATPLAAEGLTAAHLSSLEGYINDLNSALFAQVQAIDDRDQAVHERIEAGNALYDEMVKLGEVGKRLWLNVDESKYNEYVLYAHRGGEEPEADEQVFESQIGPVSVVNLSVTNLNGSETISATNTGSTDLLIYFAALPTDPPPPTAGMLHAGEHNSGTIVQAGFEAGTREYLNVYNTRSDMAGSIAVTITG